MIIYYTNEFKNTKGESHQLLEKAVLIELERELGEAPADAASKLVQNMTIGELGKPEIEGVRDFSISHSKNTWAVLFSDSYCGLDVQEHRQADFDSIARRWYHDDEYLAVSDADAEDTCGAFYRIWARREALVKSVGTSIVNSKLPSTLPGEVQFEGQTLKLEDVIIPGSEDMSAAICCESLGEIEFVELGGSNAK